MTPKEQRLKILREKRKEETSIDKQIAIDAALLLDTFCRHINIKADYNLLKDSTPDKDKRYGISFNLIWVDYHNNPVSAGNYSDCILLDKEDKDTPREVVASRLVHIGRGINDCYASLVTNSTPLVQGMSENKTSTQDSGNLELRVERFKK